MLEDSDVRTLVEEIQKQNYVKGIVCSSAGFTRSAMTFAETRPLELIGKEKLEQLLNKAQV